jgi:hypothetical protein
MPSFPCLISRPLLEPLLLLLLFPAEELIEVIDPRLGELGVEVDVELEVDKLELAATELVNVEVVLGVGGVVDAVILPWRVTFGDVGALEVAVAELVVEVVVLVLLTSRSYTASL